MGPVPSARHSSPSPRSSPRDDSILVGCVAGAVVSATPKPVESWRRGQEAVGDWRPGDAQSSLSVPSSLLCSLSPSLPDFPNQFESGSRVCAAIEGWATGEDAAALGNPRCHVVIPDDAAIEKSHIIEALGATVERVRPISITHRYHFVNIARRRALEANKLAAAQRESNETQTNGLTHANSEMTHEKLAHMHRESLISNYQAIPINK